MLINYEHDKRLLRLVRISILIFLLCDYVSQDSLMNIPAKPKIQLILPFYVKCRNTNYCSEALATSVFHLGTQIRVLARHRYNMFVKSGATIYTK